MQNIKSWFYLYRIHFLAWAIFIFYECVVVALLFDKPGAFLTYVIHYSLIILFFYLHAHIVLPWSLKNRKRIFLRLVCGISIELLLFILLLYYLGDEFLIHIHTIPVNGAPQFDYAYVIRNIYREVYYLGYASAYYFLTTYVKEKIKAVIAEKKQLHEVINRQHIQHDLTHAQNAFLKAQINPHFLFNTLEFIHNNVVDMSPTAADAIVTLAEMMRYAIDADRMDEFICIEDELQQVQNLLHLDCLRKCEQAPLRIICSEEVRHISFIPLVLLTLTENIFKHGNLQDGQEAIIKLYIENSSFVITTDNMSNRKQCITSHHTGLVNIEKRLKYAYGDDVYFKHSQGQDGHFTLTIKVPLRLLKSVDELSPVLAGIDTI